jgi:SOS-response transcriptional repressor LexA
VIFLKGSPKKVLSLLFGRYFMVRVISPPTAVKFSRNLCFFVGRFMSLSVIKTVKSQKISNQRPAKRKLADILYDLMAKDRIKQTDLSRQTGIPASTLNKIFLGTTDDPRASTLRTLAQFFGVSIDQLLGLAEAPNSGSPPRMLGFSNQISSPSNSLLAPVLHWNEVMEWTSSGVSSNKRDEDLSFVTINPQFSEKSFALKVKPSMASHFRPDALIIIDPKTEFKDGSFVLVSVDLAEPTVRMISKDGPDIYLKPLESFLTPIQLEPHHQIIGTIIETRFTF